MVMAHGFRRKGMPFGILNGVVQKCFDQNGIPTVADGEGWRMGESGPVLVLCRVMPVNDQECHFIVVAASEDSDAAVQVRDTLISFIEREALHD